MGTAALSPLGAALGFYLVAVAVRQATVVAAAVCPATASRLHAVPVPATRVRALAARSAV